MAKDAYWFKHDSNARMDERTLELRAEYGWEGYGIFWGVVEMLREQTNYRYSIDRIGGLAISIGKDKQWMDEFIQYCIGVGLFVLDNDEFFSPSLCRRMEDWDEKREKNRIAAETRWERERNADAMQTHSERNADPMLEEKRREEKKREESTKKYTSAPPGAGYSELFERFWAVYPKRKKKNDAFKAWKSQKCASILETILEAVEKQKRTHDWVKDGGQFIPYPATWIRARSWEDEIEETSSGYREASDI
jgi:hypothetical protein